MQVVVRALMVLRTVAAADDGKSLADLSAELHLAPATTHRLLAVLTEEGYLSRDSTTRRYFAGPGLLDLAVGGRPHRLPELADQYLRELGHRFDETVFLTERISDRAVCVSMVESRRPLRLSVYTGHHLPWHAAASARAILAFLDESDIYALLGSQRMTRYTTGTPQTMDDVLEHLEQVRKRGFDVCDDELDDRVWAAAAPVFDGSGAILGAVTLAAPADRISTLDSRSAVIEAVRRTARQIHDGMRRPRPVPARRTSVEATAAAD
jgi:IclR family acetate operon transcriptional repressor